MLIFSGERQFMLTSAVCDVCTWWT